MHFLDLMSVLVSSLYRIITQPRLAWWPQIDMFYSKSAELIATQSSRATNTSRLR